MTQIETPAKKEVKGADYLFLLFIILLTQGFLPLKIVGLILIYVFRPQPLLKPKFNLTGAFYVCMLLLSAFSIFYYLKSPSSNYLIVYGLGLLIWLICLLAFLQIYYHLKSCTAEKADKTIHYFFLIISISSILEILFLFISGGEGNPFSNTSAGDRVVGIFANSSLNMIVLAFFCFYYLFKKKYAYCIMAGVLALTTTYMSGLVIFFGALAVYVLLSNAISIKMKLRIVLLGFFLIVIIMVLSPGNIQYGKNILNDIGGSKQPRKIVSFAQTAEFISKSPKNFLVGAGIGNFSSRLAFFAGGEYSEIYPSDWHYRSENFQNNHFALWNKKVLAIPYNDGTANQPFSIYNQFFGEYGILGAILLLGVYMGSFYMKYSLLTYGKVLMFLMLGFFALDYWFEYFSVVIIFDWFMTRDWFDGQAQSLKQIDVK